MQSALELLLKHYTLVLESWSTLTPAQREAVLAHSGMLMRLASMTETLRQQHG